MTKKNRILLGSVLALVATLAYGQARKVIEGSSAVIIGSGVQARFGDSLSDATTKTTRLGNLHYTNTEEPLGIILGQSTSSANSVILGGGSSAVNAATIVEVYTAANNTTTTGTRRLAVNSSGTLVLDAYGTGLLGSNSSGNVSATNIWFAGAATPGGTDCTSGACTLTTTYGGYVSSITRDSTGVYTVQFSPAWASAPTCVAGNKRGHSTICNLSGDTTTTAATINCGDMAGNLIDARPTIHCFGAR